MIILLLELSLITTSVLVLQEHILSVGALLNGHFIDSRALKRNEMVRQLLQGSAPIYVGANRLHLRSLYFYFYSECNALQCDLTDR